MNDNEREELTYKFVDLVGQEWIEANVQNIATGLEKEGAEYDEAVYAGILCGFLLLYEKVKEIWPDLD